MSLADFTPDPDATFHLLIVGDASVTTTRIEPHLEAVARQLSVRGISSSYSNTLIDASHRLEQTTFDVIVLDLDLPDTQGLDSLASLLDRHRQTPVVVLTDTDDGTGPRALRRGAIDFLPKDAIDPDRLARTLRHATERHRRETSLRTRMAELDRMLTIGTLASGVAHEINNPLAFLTGNVQYTRGLLAEALETTPPSPIADAQLNDGLEALDDALEGCRRVRSVVRDLHNLTTGRNDDAFTIEVIALGDALNPSLNIARNEIEKRARLIVDLGAPPPVIGNESKLGQVFLNLLVNAAQALPPDNPAGNEVRLTTTIREAYVSVSVSDTGSGIPDEHLPHIFDPFYSTKDSEVGTGLGLAICHRIIEVIGDDIEVDTERGQGTTFNVLLPLADKWYEKACD